VLQSEKPWLQQWWPLGSEQWRRTKIDKGHTHLPEFLFQDELDLLYEFERAGPTTSKDRQPP